MEHGIIYECPISIHTTTQVVTIICQCKYLSLNISIHTTTQVVTKKEGENNMTKKISIHTTTQVVTNKSRSRLLENTDFNPHHHAGGDYWYGKTVKGPHNFNPHHHAGGDTGTVKLSKDHIISIHTTTQVVTLLWPGGLSTY